MTPWIRNERLLLFAARARNVENTRVGTEFLSNQPKAYILLSRLVLSYQSKQIKTHWIGRRLLGGDELVGEVR